MRSRSIISITTVAVILTLVFLSMGRFGQSGKVDQFSFEVASVLPRDFAITVNTMGVLDAADSQMVSSTVRGDKGKIIYIVEDGTQVAKGDVLVRLDPTPFEEELHRLQGMVKTLEAAVDANQQIQAWEKNQTEREIMAAEFDLKVAQLELKKLIEGDGPIQLAQYREEMKKAKEESSRFNAYINELKALEADGKIQSTEIGRARAKLAELDAKSASAAAKLDNYQKHVFPSQVETAKAKVQKAEMLIDQTSKGAVFKIAKAISAVKEAQERLKTAKGSLARAQAELGKTTILAPISGIAILHEAFRDGQNRKPRVGDNVWQDQPLLYLPNISSMIVKTQVREVDLHKIALQQPCTITVDAYPQDRFAGKVASVGILATERLEGGVGKKYFHLTININSEETRLRPGMTARVTIFSDHCENVLTIPFAALFTEENGIFCYRKTNGGFEKVAVKSGRKSDTWVEILSGLASGDRVSLSKPPLDTIDRD